MTLLALLLSLLLERGLTHSLHLRELRWLDSYFDWSNRLMSNRAGHSLKIAAAVFVCLPVVPVALASNALGAHLLGLPQLAFAVVVLLFSFGPRDLKDEVDDYVAALGRGDETGASSRATELLESDAVGRGAGLRVAVEEAIFVQANNRLFGVIFWFMVLGPAGAWLFRISDLMRRRAAFEASRRTESRGADSYGAALAWVHGVLAWVPARLTAASYALAGSFEDAVGSWRTAVDQASHGLLDRTEDLLARVGTGSLQPSLANVPAAELNVATVRGAWRIVSRGLWVWLAAIAVLILAGSLA